MFPAATMSGGQAIAFPDVCRVPAQPAPPVPVPYPNVSLSAPGPKAGRSKDPDCSGQGCKAKAEAFLPSTRKPVCLACYKNATGGKLPLPASSFKSSMGDEVGTLKGLISGSNMDKVKFQNLSAKVKFEGKQAVAPLMDVHHGRMLAR